MIYRIYRSTTFIAIISSETTHLELVYRQSVEELIGHEEVHLVSLRQLAYVGEPRHVGRTCLSPDGFMGSLGLRVGWLRPRQRLELHAAHRRARFDEHYVELQVSCLFLPGPYLKRATLGACTSEIGQTDHQLSADRSLVCRGRGPAR